MAVDKIKDCDLQEPVCGSIEKKSEPQSGVANQKIISEADNKADNNQSVGSIIAQSTDKLQKEDNEEIFLHTKGCLCLGNKHCLHDMHPFIKGCMEAHAKECASKSPEASDCDGNCEKCRFLTEMFNMPL